MLQQGLDKGSRELAATRDSSPFHRFYVGIDIGYKFHVAACIQREQFLDPNQAWKRAKTLKFTSDSSGLSMVLSALEEVSRDPRDFFILMEPTGGHYAYVVLKLLMDKGYEVFQVENRGVKDFRERTLGLREKSDQIDARVMAYMGFYRAWNPGLVSVQLVTPASSDQMLFRTLVRDRWLLSQQLTRRKNQIQQMFAVTNPDLKEVFAKPARPTVLRLAQRYPTAQEIAAASEEELRQALVDVGARSMARKVAHELKSRPTEMVLVDAPQLVRRQNWLIEEAQRTTEAIQGLDAEMHLVLHGDPDRGIAPHPYTELLFSLPTMSDIWACTLIGVIGDVNRFKTYRQFTKYLGFAPENAQSGSSVDKTRLTYSGVRDARRVLFQMILVLISPKGGRNVFKAFYEHRLLGSGGRKVSKMSAIGHVCGKMAHVIYGCLKSGTPYDASRHAKACGILWDKPLEDTHPLDPDVDGSGDLDLQEVLGETRRL